MRFMLSFMFFGSSSFFLYPFIGCFFCFSFIWVRGCYPRYRYDKLIYLAWKTYLPCSLLVIFFYIIFSLFIFKLSL
jgi:NADH-ubiquinone oxidoreductase chain 1